MASKCDIALNGGGVDGGAILFKTLEYFLEVGQCIIYNFKVKTVRCLQNMLLNKYLLKLLQLYNLQQQMKTGYTDMITKKKRKSSCSHYIFKTQIVQKQY